MKNSITNAYKNKEYGWFALYIFIIVFSVMEAGIVGCIISLLVIDGIYRAVKNPNFSKKKKFLFSSLYVICGVIIVIIIITTLRIIYRKYYANLPIVPAPEILNMTPVGSFPITPTGVSKDDVLYTNQTNNFTINQPKDWTVDESDKDIIVEFSDLTPNLFQAISISSDPNVGNYSQKEYAAVIQQSMGESSRNVDFIKQGNVVINGNPAYVVEFNYDQLVSNGSYPLHAISVSLIHNGIGYAILAVDQKNMDDKVLWDAISSFNFIK